MFIWQTKAWQDLLIFAKQADKTYNIDNIKIEKRKVAFWEYGLFILWVNLKYIDFNIEKKLINLCKKEKCLFIQIEEVNYNWVFSNLQLFKKSYYKKFIPFFSVIIDLSKSEQDILWEMKPKGRYNIKLAKRKEVKVKIVEKTKENIEIFYHLMKETTKRDNFFWNTLTYYDFFLKSIKNSELIFAYKEDKVIASWIFIFDKEVSIYYYWASSSDKKYRNLMAPYLLQWEAIKLAKQKDSKMYDFLWIANPWDKKSPLIWVTNFKLKFNKKYKKVSESYIWINKSIKYYFISILKKLQKSFF